MLLWHRLKTLYRNLTNKPHLDADLDAELRSYRDLLEDEKSRAGLNPAHAHREALLELGGTEQIKEQVRDVRLGQPVTWDDVQIDTADAAYQYRRAMEAAFPA